MIPYNLFTKNCGMPDQIIPIHDYGKIVRLASNKNFVAASFAKRDRYLNEERKICFWDLINKEEEPQTMEFSSRYLEVPQLVFNDNTCFFTDTTNHKEAVLGCINGNESTMEKIPYSYSPSLSACELIGATFGSQKNDCSKLIFWDLFSMREAASSTVEWQGRNLCAIIPNEGTPLVVTLQSGTYETPNLFALWDSRTAGKPIKEKVIPYSKGRDDIHSMGIIETKNGPYIVSRSTDNTKVEIRNILDQAFGELYKTILVIEGAYGPYACYNLDIIPANRGVLCTATKDSYYEGKPGNSSISKKVTIKAYDFTLDKDNLEPKIVLKFPPRVCP